MVKNKSIVLVATVIALFNLTPAYSQKKAEWVDTRWADKPIVADGVLDDWPDSVMFYNESTRLKYRLANDDKYIYLALKSNTHEDLTRILAGGISFSANIESKKKDPPTVIFPVLDRTPGRPRNLKEQPEVEEIQRQVLARIKDIKVKGFKEIVDGGISLQNMYGIRAAATFNKENNLVQEIIIPLNLLNMSISQAGEITYNIKINGLPGPSGMSRQSMPPQPMGRMLEVSFLHEIDPLTGCRHQASFSSKAS